MWFSVPRKKSVCKDAHTPICNFHTSDSNLLSQDWLYLLQETTGEAKHLRLHPSVNVQVTAKVIFIIVFFSSSLILQFISLLSMLDINLITAYGLRAAVKHHQTLSVPTELSPEWGTDWETLVLFFLSDVKSFWSAVCPLSIFQSLPPHSSYIMSLMCTLTLVHVLPHCCFSLFPADIRPIRALHHCSHPLHEKPFVTARSFALLSLSLSLFRTHT